MNASRIFALFGIIAALVLGAAAAGAAPGDKTALYGEPETAPAAAIPRVRPMSSTGEGWKDAPFYFIQTELSPATLYGSRTDFLQFFAGLKEYGLGGPSFAAYVTRDGAQVVRVGGAMDAASMSENWVLVWFAGTEGWTHWDSPWVVYLQKKPATMTLDAAGLAFQFPKTAGQTVVMPLYGYYKPPQEGGAPFAAGLPVHHVRTSEWAKGLPVEVLERVRYWAKVSREYPLYCEDSFSVDRSRDIVEIRQRFHWLSIDDDWKTPHLKLAPISPPLALTSLAGNFPVRFSRPPKDPEMFTPYGPYTGIEGVDVYDAEFKVLQYINQTEAVEEPRTDAHPTVQAALEKLREAARGKFRNPERYSYDHGGLNNFCWAIQGDQWYAKGLPYYEPATRATAIASLRKYFHEDVLVPQRFVEREYPKGSGRTYLILEGPGIGSWGVLGDAGKFSSNLLETLWAYAQYTGDWELVRSRWPLVKKLFCTPSQTRWVSFGRDEIAELGDEAAPCLAMARLAYKAGDIDTYHYAAYQFARELVHHFIKQRGAAYFRQRQPWHTMEPMPEEVYLTNLWGDVAGWQIDGPAWPKAHGERQYTNRWVRFKDADVGRFYQDHLKEDVRKELDLLQGRWDAKRRWANDSHIMPSLVQLRSLLLNETPEELARVATPEQFSGPASGVIASCIAVLRTSHPTHLERLIPYGKASPFVAGLEREVAGPNPYLAQAVWAGVEDREKKTSRTAWPLVTWWQSWKTPTGHRWTFGHVLPTPGGAPTAAQQVPLNWNTQVTAYTMAEPISAVKGSRQKTRRRK
jgi:hypothetical protein